MIFLRYEISKRQYIEARKRYEALLTEKEELFQKTQPKSMQYDQERVVSGNTVNLLEDYVIKKEQTHLDDRIEEAKAILLSRAEFLAMDENELRKSKDIRDIVYCYRYLDRMKIRKIKRITNYSEAQIYRILGRIKKEIDTLGG